MLKAQIGNSSHSKISIRTFSLLIFVAAVLLYVPPLYRTPFSSKGEGREALVVSNMREQQEFILPLRNGTEIPSKPPCFHWIAYGLAQLQGNLDEGVIRLPSALAAATGLVVFFLFLSQVLPLQRALVSVLLLSSSLEWFRSAGLARVDMLFTLWLTLSCLILYALTRREGKHRSSLTIMLSLVLACGALTKGPAAIVLPWVIFGTWYGVKRLLKIPTEKLPLLFLGSAALLSLFLACLWYYLAYQKGGASFLQIHLMKENAARVLGMDDYEVGHQKPFFYSIVYLFSSFLPWSLFLPVVMHRLWKERKLFLRAENDFLLYCLVWFSIFFIVVTVAVSKRGVYFLPSFPALSVLMALALENLNSKFHRELQKSWSYLVSHFLFFLFVVIVILACALYLLGVVYPFRVTNFGTLAPSTAQQAGALVESAYGAWHVLPQVLLIVTLLGVGFKRWRHAQYTSGIILSSVGVLFFSQFIALSVFPAIAKENSPKDFIVKVMQQVPPVQPFFQYQEELYPAMYYANRNIIRVLDVGGLPRQRAGYVLVRGKLSTELLRERTDCQQMMESDGLVFYGEDTLLLFSCGLLESMSPGQAVSGNDQSP